jgi:hypothetical protein
MRVTTQTTSHEDLGRSSVRPGAHLATAPSPNDAAGERRNHGGGDAFGLAGSASP